VGLEESLGQIQKTLKDLSAKEIKTGAFSRIESEKVPSDVSAHAIAYLKIFIW
jgi:hypothetical protein